MADDDDEGGFGGLYEDGHWVWDDTDKTLVFVSDLPPKPVEAIQILAKAPTGTVEFRDDVDLIEQIRFRRRYQRKLKPGQADVITVQDVKDIALYTAPVQIMSPILINLLHLPTTERFIRALILYTAYYLQISDEMADRILEMEKKIRTPHCEILEHEFRDNLADLRVLVAKEYSVMLIGGSDTRKFHHMGPAKKRRSLSDKDARQFETLLRMCVQIVWLALGRKSFNQIELETNRMFKSEIFNAVEHTLKTGFISKMAKEERVVLLGHCLRYDKKLNTRSPLMNEVFCHRQIDYRMMGLGVLKIHQMSPRLHYMLQAIAGPEENLHNLGVSVGILGLPRTSFDTMLKPLPTASGDKSKTSFRFGPIVKVVQFDGPYLPYSTAFTEHLLETNRMFKSEIFNAVEHTLKTGFISKMAKEERVVLLGHCLRYDKKLNTRSPLMNEVFCHRQIDYRMMGLGVLKIHQMSPRLHYMLQAIAGPEENLHNLGVSVGILGLPRTSFDTMLKPLPTASGDKSKTSFSAGSSASRAASSPTASMGMAKSSTTANKVYPDVVLPAKESREVTFPAEFPDEPEKIRACSETQRRRWQNRLVKLLHPHGV